MWIAHAERLASRQLRTNTMAHSRAPAIASDEIATRDRDAFPIVEVTGNSGHPVRALREFLDLRAIEMRMSGCTAACANSKGLRKS